MSSISVLEKNSSQSASASRSPSIASARQDLAPDNEIQEMLTPQLSREPSHVLARKTTSVRTSDPQFEVDWEGSDDPQNPLNWSTWYKGFVIGTLSWGTLVVAMYSSSYTSGIYQMQAEFDIANESVATLGLTTYLLGLAVGVLVAAPMSEMFGRRKIFLASMVLFVALIAPTGVGSTLTEVVVVRFFGALFGAALVTNAPGTLGDITNDEHRALVFSIWSIGPLNGPVFGPLLGGFATQYLGWRWANWIVMMFGGLAMVLMFCVKETYAPTILRKKTQIRRDETGDPRWWCRYDEKSSFWPLLKVNLSRPLVMAVTEPICIFWIVYIGIVYAILYLCFVAYPIVFTEIRGWSISDAGLSFMGNGVGQFLAIFMEPLFRRLIRTHKKDPETGRPSLDAMMSVVCIGAFAAPIGQLWFAWTCAPPVHWIWPVLAGIPFGFGNIIIFIYGLSYLVGCYGLYGASASAGNTFFRSILGAVLPLAGPAMYTNLGANWAASLCGFLLVAIIPIPFIFYKYGSGFRKRSVLIAEMRREMEKLEGKRNSRSAGDGDGDLEQGNESEALEKAIEVEAENGIEGGDVEHSGQAGDKELEGKT